MEVLNYQPNANAQALAVQNTDTIGVVVTDVTDPFLLLLVEISPIKLPARAVKKRF